MVAINPYLNFNGKCEEAFTLYRTVFGGEFTTFQRFKDVPTEHAEGHNRDGMMHVALPIGGNTVLMGSDSSDTTPNGSSIQISVQTETDDETDRIFNGLAAGGQIIMPLENTFWGARFGMLTDKFGIQWMVNQQKQPMQ